jgi:hypothetical protein
MNKLTTILTLITAVFGMHHTLTAHPVDLQTAQSVAVKFMGVRDAQLISTFRTDKSTAAFYVFNTEDGFVIVSADDCETPIIGYSHEGRFDPNDVPEQMETYLQDFVARIQYGIENHIDADELTARQWDLVTTTGRLNESKSTKSVEPLLTEMWEQGCHYNDLCPAFSKVPCGHAEVGCVAVAMGQIMHYWKYPTTGWGSHSYFNSGTLLSADFGNTIYDWDHMPDSLTDNSSETEIEAIATLLFHCGVSVDMNYTTNGSGADSGDVPNALIRYFNYSRRLHIEKRSDFNDEEWMSMLKACLDLQRPIFYGGRGSQGSHAFVCDGYDNNDLLHFNWGWGRANGYFALGHLNPIGYNFSEKNFAILDINPEYEPWIIEATAYPPTAGTIEGIGTYHIGDSCALIATSTENYTFYGWKKNGQIISDMPMITFRVEDDVLDFEAHFTCSPVSQITASYSPDANNPNSPSVSLSWNSADTEWNLLKQFEINEELGGIATDNEYIYVTYGEWNDPLYSFGKYTMDGDLIEQFNIENITRPVCLSYDGTNFYCNCSSSGLQYIHHIDLVNRMALDSTNMKHWFGTLTYDPDYDGFWLGQNYYAVLYNRQGQILKTSPSTAPDFILGAVYFTANDGNPHLLLSMEASGVYDYDITNNFIFRHPLLPMYEEHNYNIGACSGIYDGKDAAFLVIGDIVYIYEINRNLSQIIGYNIYRKDSDGHSVKLADEVSGTEYIDATWNNANAGVYRFGISEVYANGVESEIIWSDTIVKTDFGIDENGNQESPEPSVQKVIEDGHIIIIKDGKRYSVSGQKLN